jgi:hypothetical protein
MATQNNINMHQSVPPGISWTAPEKSRPWHNPPKMTKVSQIAEMYMNQLSSPSIANHTLDVLETGQPISVIAQTIMMTGVASGQHTIDAGMLVMPVIMEMLASIAVFNGIRTALYPGDFEKMFAIDDRVARMAISKAYAPTAKEAPAPVAEKKPTGLMTRKTQEVK